MPSSSCIFKDALPFAEAEIGRDDNTGALMELAEQVSTSKKQEHNVVRLLGYSDFAMTARIVGFSISFPLLST